jgi:hypothetical protein
MDIPTIARPIFMAIAFLAGMSAAAAQTPPDRVTSKPESDTKTATRVLDKDEPKSGKADQTKPVRATIKVEPDIQAPARKPDDAGQAPRPDKAARTDPPAKPASKRRAVQQVITPAYRPPAVAADSVVKPTFGLPAAAMPAQPGGPIQLNCNATGCTDANGMRCNSGVGTALIDANGRSCTRSGTTAQCN